MAREEKSPGSMEHRSDGQSVSNRDRENGLAGLGSSRREFLKTGATVAGLSTVGVGLNSQVAAAERVAVESDGGQLDVTDAFTLIDNQWGNPDADQRVWIDADGSYGWDFDATGTSDGINYPEVYIGTRPWGSDTGVAEFPIRRGDVEEFVLDVDASFDISGGEWNCAEEWWLMEEKPSVETGTYQYEVMLLLDWGEGHDHGSPVYTDLWTDEYGNTIDLWALYDSGGTSATFYIFRVQGGHDGGKVNVERIVDWLTDHEGIREDLWISGSELGTEYWPEAAGEVRIEQFDVTINGTTYRSNENADDGSGADETAPSAPANLSATVPDSSSVDLAWDAASDSGGSGLDHYNVFVDGAKDHEVGADTTATTVSGLSAGTEYDFSVTAVDGAGNESDPSNAVSVATDEESGGDDDSDGGDGDDGIQSGSVYRIENAHSGKVLDVERGSKRNGGNVLQWPSHGGANQHWRVVEDGDGTYRIENENSGKVLDVEGGSTADGANVLQWTDHGADNQRWRFVENDDGTHRIECVDSGKVLDVEGASKRSGANVLQWSWHGGDNQRWTLSPVDDA